MLNIEKIAPTTGNLASNVIFPLFVHSRVVATERARYLKQEHILCLKLFPKIIISKSQFPKTVKFDTFADPNTQTKH